jgi:hypothetical protein
MQNAGVLNADCMQFAGVLHVICVRIDITQRSLCLRFDGGLSILTVLPGEKGTAIRAMICCISLLCAKSP